MMSFVQRTIESIGYVGVGLLVFIENIFPPIPSEVVIPFAGFTAWQSDDFTLFGMILAGAIDPVPGALPLYYPGLGGIPGGRTSLRIMTTLQTQHESRYRHVMLFKTTPNK